MASLEVARDARDPRVLRIEFALRVWPSAREALHVAAFGAIGLAVLTLPRVPVDVASAAASLQLTVPSAEPAHVLRAVRPLVTVPRPEPPSVRRVAVAAGETLFTLADRYRVTPQTIAYNNGITDSGALRPGASLLVPTIDAALHVVREDDTVEAVAARYGADPGAVVDANRLVYEPDNFTPGATILVPVPDGDFPGFRLRVSETARTAPILRVLTRGRLLWPVAGIVTQGFYLGHLGVDLAAPYGTPVVSSESGTVAAAGWVAAGGLRVCVRHDWGLQTCYYHLGATSVSEGQRVARGQRLGSIGLTGVTTGPHVHWEASVEGAFLDPLSY